jgi:outer membrane protein OmpA-like peptidoglycan-associated protein
MNYHNPPALSAIAGLAGTALLLCAASGGAQEVRASGELLPAEPGDFSLKVEPGLAIPLTAPQSDLFGLGGGQTIKALWALSPYFDIGPSATFITMPAEGTAPGEAGTAWTFGAGVRLKRAHHVEGDALSAISPWLDVDALYVRTGDLNRAGFAAAVGLAVPVGEDRSFWLGPFARYLHILQGSPEGYDNHDAKILSLGVSLEWGPGIEREPEPEPEPVALAEAPPAPIEKEGVECPDGDGDGILDSIDRCPEVPGTADNWGCRAYQKIVVSKDKLELKERLYFAWNQATIQEVSHPALDEVVLALKENENFRVQVEGHTSSEGGEEHNQTLSEQRAEAVLDYLVAHGIEKERLVSKGFASSVPTDTNDTAAGRDNNRRVEFVVNFIILDGGTK